ncbi:transcription factor E2F6-like [Solea senegalensis]|uniref:Transcription factor E2F6-like n=1 Tax=Solea senegalensis TaxID=28829 RepID=A0AAV6PE65_SOLSE|nr:transcription factor E2F6-like isoform X2 [Solea senegalensis]KAG7460408.1 transcription factor E2F6-like [Solea senegalensis]
MECVVAACQNRVLTEGRGNSGRAMKRFFGFPADPARVKVWLAALRQMDGGQDSLQEDGHICEDHFLPEDVTSDGVSSDAVPFPIRPPSLEEQPGVRSSWGAPLSEEEEQQEEEEEEADSSNIHDDDDDDDDENDAAVELHHQESSPKKSSRRKRKSVDENQTSETIQRKQRNKSVPKKSLMQRFLQLLQTAPGGCLNLRRAAELLGCRNQRLNEFRNVMYGLNLIESDSTAITWTSQCPVISFLMRYETFQEELQLREETLDALIRSSSKQLFTVTDDRENAAMAYVTHGDIGRIPTFRDQTVIVVKAPDGTTLKVPEPEEDRIQVHLKGAGPITALTCDLMTEDTSVFVSLEESQMKTMKTESSGSQSVCS